VSAPYVIAVVISIRPALGLDENTIAHRAQESAWRKRLSLGIAGVAHRPIRAAGAAVDQFRRADSSVHGKAPGTHDRIAGVFRDLLGGAGAQRQQRRNSQRRKSRFHHTNLFFYPKSGPQRPAPAKQPPRMTPRCSELTAPVCYL